MLAVPDLFASGSVDLHHVGGALLRAEFDAVESDASGVVLDDVNHVACALLLHFADLSHPLATTTLHDCFVDAASVTEHKEVTRKKNIKKKDHKRKLFCFIFYFLFSEIGLLGGCGEVVATESFHIVASIDSVFTRILHSRCRFN